MKFVKGMLVGGLLSAGVAMIYAGTMEQNKKKVMKMGGDYEKEISDRKIYNPVCDWRNGIFFAGSFSTWIFTLFDVFMWWGMFPLLWASKRKCKDQDKFY